MIWMNSNNYRKELKIKLISDYIEGMSNRMITIGKKYKSNWLHINTLIQIFKNTFYNYYYDKQMYDGGIVQPLDAIIKKI